MTFSSPVTYVPGPRPAVVGDGVALVLDSDPAGPVVAACRAAVQARAGADAVLAAVPDGTSFVLAAVADGGLRLAAGGRGQAEFAAGARPTVAAAGGRVDTRHDGGPAVRLSLADPTTPVPEGPLLPVDSGVVLVAALIAPQVRPTAAPLAPSAASPTPPVAAKLPDPPAPPAPVRPEATTASVGVPVLPWRALAPDGAPPSNDPTVIGAGFPSSAPPPVTGTAIPPLLAVPPAPRDLPPAADGAPVVQAVVCANNHLNAPFVVGACRVCGAPVPAQAPFLTPRPTLGVLVLGTGETVPVDRDILLGRAPSPGAGEPSPPPRLVSLPSPQNDLSRTHARVWIDGWLVQVADLGSTNGTVVTMPGQQPVRLRPDEPFVLVPGTVVNLADEAQLRFEVPQ